jgi:hypothetical protein
LVGQRAASDEASVRGDLAGELRVGSVDAGVDDRDARARQGRQLGPEVERADVLQVPLLRRERVVRRERRAARNVETLDVLDAGEVVKRLGSRRIDEERAKVGERAIRRRAEHALDGRGDVEDRRAGLDADRVARSRRGRRLDERGDEHRREGEPHPTTRRTGDTPGTSPRPGETRAR